MNSSLNPFPYVSAASNSVMPRSNALCMSEIASPSVKFPHQPVEIVQSPKPTSLTVRSVFLYVRKRISDQLSEWRSKRPTPNIEHPISNEACRGASPHAQMLAAGGSLSSKFRFRLPVSSSSRSWSDSRSRCYLPGFTNSLKELSVRKISMQRTHNLRDRLQAHSY